MLKTEVLPYDNVDFAAVLDALAEHGFIVKYAVDGDDYGLIPSWKKHQVINAKEAKSRIPAPSQEARANTSESTGIHIHPTPIVPVNSPESTGIDLKTQESASESTGTDAHFPVNTSESIGSHTMEGEGEMEGNGKEKKPAPNGACRTGVRPEDFANEWNRLRGPLPKVQSFTDDRRRKVKVRINQGITLEQFREAVRKCVTTPFLMGDNARNWQADFDFLIENGTNIVKVLEGRYDGGNVGHGGARPGDRFPVSKALTDEEFEAKKRKEAEQLREDRVMWESMSDEFKRKNPWSIGDGVLEAERRSA
jgi:hypothetical protein